MLHHKTRNLQAQPAAVAFLFDSQEISVKGPLSAAVFDLRIVESASDELKAE